MTDTAVKAELLEAVSSAINDRAGRTEYGPIIPEGLLEPIAEAAIAAVRRAESQPPALTEAVAWLPIDTAPTDGSSILAICGTAYSPVAGVTWWQDGWTHYSRPAEKWHGGFGKWFPTHWMPLPSFAAPPVGVREAVARLEELAEWFADDSVDHMLAGSVAKEHAADLKTILSTLSPGGLDGGALRPSASVPTEGQEAAVLVQRMVSQIVLDLRFRGYANHDGDRDWVKEASAWDRIGARLFGLPVCPSCGRFDGRHDDDCACQAMSDADSDSFEASARQRAVAPSDEPECDTCGGSGKIVEEARTTGANQHSACQRGCDECDGTGRSAPTPEQPLGDGVDQTPSQQEMEQ